MILHKQYEFEPSTDRIGQGGFATVYKARDLNLDIDVALKRYSQNDGGKGSVIKEIRKCFHLQHSNIIRYYNCFRHSYTDHLGQSAEDEYGVMQYADSGHFGEIIESKRKIPDAEFKAIVSGILDGLEYLHTRTPAIIHRDLKPANILLNKEDGRLIPKICDFGISKVASTGTDTSTTSGFLGSIEYMAPEQLNMDRFGKDGHLQPNADLWALGCMLYEYFTSKSPFGKRSEQIAPEVIYSNILSGEPLYGYDAIPEPYKRFIVRCLEKDAGKRVQKAGELKDILNQIIGFTIMPPVPTDPPGKIEPANPPKNVFYIISFAIILILFSVFLYQFGNGNTVKEVVEDDSHVTNWLITNSKGETFTYTGAVHPNASKTIPEGQGKAVFSNGDTYEGNFVNGLRSGDGKYTWSDGEYFIGEFKNNLRDGCGAWYGKTNLIFQQGKYKNGEFVSDICP
jgi:serine/threonine protein kinase